MINTLITGLLMTIITIASGKARRFLEAAEIGATIQHQSEKI